MWTWHSIVRRTSQAFTKVWRPTEPTTAVSTIISPSAHTRTLTWTRGGQWISEYSCTSLASNSLTGETPIQVRRPTIPCILAKRKMAFTAPPPNLESKSGPNFSITIEIGSMETTKCLNVATCYVHFDLLCQVLQTCAVALSQRYSTRL